MATLLVGANLPDVDAYTYAFSDSPTALAFRRGWTRGILAMAVRPVVLAGAMTAERSGALVSLRDARYPSSWASVTIAVPAGLLRSSP